MQHLVALHDLHAPKQRVPKFNEVNDFCFPKPWTSRGPCQKLEVIPRPKTKRWVFPNCDDMTCRLPSSSRVLGVERKPRFPKRSRCLRKWPSNMWWRNVFLLKVESTQIQRLDDVDSQLDAAPLDRSEQISVQRSVTIIHKIYGHHTSTIMIWDDFRHKYS